jgi:hypothetical protein
MATSRAQMNALLRQLEKPVREAFLTAIAEARSFAKIKALTDAVVTGDPVLILRAAGLREGMYSTTSESIRAAYMEGGTMTMATELSKTVAMSFDITNPRAEAWLRSNSAKLVVDLKATQEKAIQVILRDGMALGNNPRTTALDIAGRIAKTGRRSGGVLGLTEHQANIVTNMRNDLRTLDWQSYKSRKLRDRRFDSVVRKSMKAGKPLPAKVQNKIVDRYSDRWLKHRADTIARTETLKALNASADEALNQVVEEGLAPRHAVTRIWRHSFSKNERAGHVAMNGQPRGLDEPFVNPYTKIALMYPGDPAGGAGEVVNCRCYVEHQIDFAAVANAA